MQDKYLLDIGDYVKFALLRALVAPDADPANLADEGPILRLGVIWYRAVDAEENNDGMKVRHLEGDGRSAIDPGLLSAMRGLWQRVEAGEDRVLELFERAQLLPGASYASEFLPRSFVDGVARQRQKPRRIAERASWWATAHAKVKSSDVVFADPDNGLMPPGRRPGDPDEHKSMRYDELVDLLLTTEDQPRRVVVVYQQLDRHKGGWLARLDGIRRLLRQYEVDDAFAGYLRSRLGSGRAFLVFTRCDAERARCEAAVARLLERSESARWIRGKLEWHDADGAARDPAIGASASHVVSAPATTVPASAALPRVAGLSDESSTAGQSDVVFADPEGLNGRLAGLPAAHPARASARRLALGLGIPDEARQPAVLQTAGWHFAAHALAADPNRLMVTRSGHNHGMHSDLEVHTPDWEMHASFTWTSGVRSMTGVKNADYVDAFLLRRRAEEQRLRHSFGGGRDEHHPIVAAALVLRAATDPSLGWSADIDDEIADSTEWWIGPGGTRLLAVRLDESTVVGPQGSVPAGEFAGELDDPLARLETSHRILRELAGIAGPA